MKRKMKHVIAALLTIVLAMSMTAAVYAGDITASQEQTGDEYTYEAPTAPIEVDDNIITASAHRAASPILGIMGLNAPSGFGMINGGAPEDLATAEASPALGVWGTALNDNPDPYFWNYFYNFYAAENGLELSEDALVNANVSASPAAADSTLLEEYGNVSVSISSRPDILIGVAAGNGDDTTGYDEQIATIHSFTSDSPYYQEGDETYNPQLVSYQTTYIKQMIESVKRLADAIDVVAEETGKTTRYEDAQIIAADYETYVYGIISYIQSKLAEEGKEQKIVAVVTNIMDAENNLVEEIDDSLAGTYKYTIADGLSTSATSLVRAYEYSMCVATDLLEALDYEDVDVTTTETDREGNETSSTETYHVVDLDTLLQADVIITINNSNISAELLNGSFGDQAYDGIEITNTPSALYGVTMNSVENAMGYAFVIGCMYNEYLNPIELCAYFYQHFYHISVLENIEKVVRTNFAQATLPGDLGNTLPSTYSAENIEACLLAGAQYYSQNTDLFTDESYELVGLSDWNPDYDLEDSILYVDVEIQTGPGPAEEPEATEAPDTTETEPGPVVTEEPTDTTETEPGPVETEAPATTVTESGPQTSSSSGIATWVWVVIVVVIVVIVIIIVAVVAKKKKKDN